MRTKRLIITTGLTGLLIGTVASPAFAAPAVTPVTQAKSAALTQIDSRLFWTGVQGYLLAGDRHVPTTDRQVLTVSLDSSTATLKALRVAVNASTTLAQVKAEAAKISRARTFDFVLPQVADVRASDDLLAAETALNGRVATYRTDIQKASSATNIAAAKKALAAYQSHIYIASTLSGEAHKVVSLKAGAAGDGAALTQSAVKNFEAALHVIAAGNDGSLIARLTSSK